MPEEIKDIRIEDFPNFPFVYVELPDLKIAEGMIRRSILIGMFIEVFSEGKSIEEIIKNTD